MLANQIGIAGVAMGTLMVGFQGFGDALEAVNKARLDPTVENIAAANQALQQIPPSAREAVTYVASLRDEWKRLRTAAADGIFPGMVDGLDALVDGRLADGERILGAIGRTLGSIARDGGESLASGRWDSFFDMLATEGPTTLRGLTDALGNLAHAGAATWDAFTPLNRDFTSWLVDATEKIDRAASGLKGSAGMDAFIDYVRTAGPQVAETLGAVATAVLEIGVAAAPLGGPVLAAIEAIADATSAIARSDAGTALITLAAGYVAVSRAMQGVQAIQSKMGVGSAALAGSTAEVTGIQKQVSALKSLPTAYREAKTAQTGLLTAQREARTITGQYVGQLRAANEATARGVPQSAAAHARLADSLSKVEMANYGVARAEERSRAATTARNTALRQTAASAGKAAALAGGLAVVTSGAADEMGLANTASLAMAGSLAGPWGAAVGGGVGLAMDLAASNNRLEQSMASVNRLARSGDLAGLNSVVAQTKRELADTRSIDGFGDVLSTIRKDVAATFSGDFDRQNTIEQGAARAEEKAQRLRTTLETVGFAMDKSLFRGPGNMSVIPTTEKLEQVARRAAPAMQDLGLSLEDLQNMSPTQLRAAAQDIANWSREANLGSSAANQFGLALGRLQGVLGRRDSMRGFEEAIDAAREALQQNGRTLDINTAKGRANQAALDQIAASAAAAAEKMKPLERRQFMAGAAENFIKTARAMGMGEKAAIKLANRMGLIPDKKTTRLLLESKAAEARIKAVQRMVDKYGLTRAQARALLNDAASGKIKNVQQLINKYGVSKKTAQALLNDLASGKIRGVINLLNSVRDKTVTLRTNRIDVTTRIYRQSGGRLDTYGGLQQADGGTVPGQRFPYGDKIPLLAAPGEEVITNRHGEADFFRRELKAINSGNAELLRKIVLARGYAEGGTVTRLGAPTMFAQPSVSVGSPSVSVGAPSIRVYVGGNEIRDYVVQVADDRVGNARANDLRRSDVRYGGKAS